MQTFDRNVRSGSVTLFTVSELLDRDIGRLGQQTWDIIRVMNELAIIACKYFIGGEKWQPLLIQKYKWEREVNNGGHH